MLNKVLYLFLYSILIFSCKSKGQNIELNQIRKATNDEVVNEFHYKSTNGRFLIMEVSTDENLKKINANLTFRLICTKDEKSIQLPLSELSEKLIIDSYSNFLEGSANKYKYLIETNFVQDSIKNMIMRLSPIEQRCLSCKFIRPGYVLTKGYESGIIKIPITHLQSLIK